MKIYYLKFDFHELNKILIFINEVQIKTNNFFINFKISTGPYLVNFSFHTRPHPSLNKFNTCPLFAVRVS